MGRLAARAVIRNVGRRILGSRSPSARTPGAPPPSASSASDLRSLATSVIPALGQDPIVLTYFPLVRNNPFQQLLYTRAWDAGIAAIAVGKLEAIDALPSLPARAWFHIHWTAPILAGARDRTDAEARLRVLTARLDTLIDHGVRLAWTVHNVLPHEHVFTDLEADLCRMLAERAHLIHTLSPDTPALTRAYFKLPHDRVRLIEHPSYMGVYPNVVSRAEARARLRLPHDATVLACIGAIRAYKGIDLLIDAFRSTKDPLLRLVIAGPPVRFPGANALRKRGARDPRILVHLERVDENDLQLYLNAADAVVLPYTDVLNSGALMLALTFGKPVIAARAGAMPGVIGDEAGMLFTPGDAADLARVLGEAKRLKDPRFAEAARALSVTRDPQLISGSFARTIRELSS